MGTKLILASMTLAAVAVVGCEHEHHDHHSGAYYPSQAPVGYGGNDGYYDGGYYNNGGHYNGGYYDRDGHWHNWDGNAYPAGARVEPDHDYDRDRDHDGHHDRDHNEHHDRDHDHDSDHDHDGDHY